MKAMGELSNGRDCGEKVQREEKELVDKRISSRRR